VVFLATGFLAAAFLAGAAFLVAVEAAGLSLAGVEPIRLASCDFMRAALLGAIIPHLAALSIIENDLAIVVAETPLSEALRAVLRRRFTSVFFSATRSAFLALFVIGILERIIPSGSLPVNPPIITPDSLAFSLLVDILHQDMETTPKAQTVELIKQAKTVLILTHRDPDGDALGASLALQAALRKIGKTVDTVFQGSIVDVL
jgi:hypothetical protein